MLIITLYFVIFVFCNAAVYFVTFVYFSRGTVYIFTQMVEHCVLPCSTPALTLAYPLQWASLISQLVKNLPAMQETWVQSQVGKIPLEEGVATYSSFVAWRTPMDRIALTVHGITKNQTPLSD